MRHGQEGAVQADGGHTRTSRRRDVRAGVLRRQAHTQRAGGKLACVRRSDRVLQQRLPAGEGGGVRVAQTAVSAQRPEDAADTHGPATCVRSPGGVRNRRPEARLHEQGRVRQLRHRRREGHRRLGHMLHRNERVRRQQEEQGEEQEREGGEEAHSPAGGGRRRNRRARRPHRGERRGHTEALRREAGRRGRSQHRHLLPLLGRRGLQEALPQGRRPVLRVLPRHQRDTPGRELHLRGVHRDAGHGRQDVHRGAGLRTRRGEEEPYRGREGGEECGGEGGEVSGDTHAEGEGDREENRPPVQAAGLRLRHPPHPGGRLASLVRVRCERLVLCQDQQEVLRRLRPDPH
mmetsp:Transcript_33289/g.79544  ORF Transcript_33289/g.79544 Transcript_33289/m.79544 type:complete len:347 (+) Transcript_33289:944-1984(+)